MNSPRFALASRAAAADTYPQNKPWTVRSAPAAPAQRLMRSVPLTRRYEVSWLTDEGEVDSFTRVAPAMPVFEQAFSAFAHGALIATEDGPVAVEDLQPGMRIATGAKRPATLKWVGAMTLVPGAPTVDEVPHRLYRVTADAFGPGRPAADVTFGPAARLLKRDSALAAALGCDAALAPIADFEDSMGVVALNPVSPVRVYHLAFDSHQIVRAGGIEVESFHPGADAQYSLSSEMRALFLSLFPFLSTLQGFGRARWPRRDGSERELYEFA